MFNALQLILHKLTLSLINISICFDYLKSFTSDEKLRALVVIF